MTRKTKRIIKKHLENALICIAGLIAMLAIIAIIALSLDFMGLMAWVASGQVPEGGFDTGYYLGKVSYIIITSLII